MAERAKIKIGVACNNACVFCAALKEGYHRDFEPAAAALTAARRAGAGAALITGLEPTVFSRFFDVLAVARRLGFGDVAVDTNARAFADSGFARRAVSAGMDAANVLFPHHTARGYAAVTGAGAGFAESAAGARNLLALGVDVAARIPICAENYTSLAGILKHIRKQGIKRARAYFPRDYMFGGAEFDAGTFDASVGGAVAFAARAGMTFDCDRASRAFHYLAEMDERTAVSFYPSFEVGRARRPEALEALIRPVFACNQICKFCWVDTSVRKPPAARVLSEIDYVVAERIPRLAFSGGEPTLDARLPEYVGRAKRGGVRQVELHTNAVRLSNRELCARLAGEGLDLAYCTLLAPDAAVSDSITRTEGTFRKTVAGILNLLEAGVHVVIHTVVMGDNYALMPALVEFTDRHFSDGPRKTPLNFSYAAPRDMKAMSDGVVPRFSAAAPHLEAAIRRCGELGVPFAAGEGLKGVPPCVLPFRDKYAASYRPGSKGRPGGAFVKKDSCADCAFDATCFGVRRFYAEYYGLDEIEPVAAAKPKRARPGVCCK